MYEVNRRPVFIATQLTASMSVALWVALIAAASQKQSASSRTCNTDRGISVGSLDPVK